MNQKCFLCNNAGAKIINRPNGYDGNDVICPQCTHYKISRNAADKIIHGHKVPISLSDKVKSHFKDTKQHFEINTITLSFL
jgi:hypothetical protein